MDAQERAVLRLRAKRAAGALKDGDLRLDLDAVKEGLSLWREIIPLCDAIDAIERELIAAHEQIADLTTHSAVSDWTTDEWSTRADAALARAERLRWCISDLRTGAEQGTLTPAAMVILATDALDADDKARLHLEGGAGA